ncbi:MAG TPA: SDR family NAD(P)-dependent oxidoreductase [candidate division Zixibacteria bacterium]|nr:SDR family NAD(P)-dependent oxidoreductase [candidate division Zixibacteria bacterium]HEQ99344.1 SDR family NAD(P)-dependent oxidoreductase [candidate division Zixibacteria bacterium]
MILVTGATGKIGSRLAKHLMESGNRIRVVSRSEEKIEDFKKKGAEPAVGNLLDRDFCLRAFDGCGRAFLLVQGDPASGRHYEEEVQIGKNYAEALRTTDIEHAIFISSLGVEKGTGSALIDSKIQIEADLKDTGIPVTVIRPGNFLENMYNFFETISSAGFFTYPMPGNIKIPHVSVDDIAEIAFKAFRRGPNGWEIIDMPGIEYSFFDIAMEISEKLNRMIKYMRVSDDQFREVFTGFGISDKFCDDYLAMFRYFEEGDFNYDPQSMPSEFDYSPKTLEEFVPELVRAIK